MVHAKPSTKFELCDIECRYIVESSMATECTHVGECPEDAALEDLIRLGNERVDNTVTEADIRKRVLEIFQRPDNDPEFQEDLISRLKSALGYEGIRVA